MGNELNDETIAELKAKYGEIIAYELEGAGDFVFCAPKRIVFGRLTNAASTEGADKYQALHDFTRSCLVWPVDGDGPNYAAFESATAMNPKAVTEIAGSLREMGGKVSVKKL